VCAPTRASLMTGRFNYRTGVTDTFLGRALMHTDEVTLAEMLGSAGYRTAIFGKWHLGDNAPMRPIDQGFQESLVLKGGGIGQPSDPPGGTHYFDPILQHNGKPETRKGYCSDVFTDAAIDYIAESRKTERPFFVYLAFNAPHAPLEVPESYREPYAKADLSNDRFPKVGYPLPGPAPADVTARVYGMVTNIDDNLGRLFARLDELGVSDNTLVIFLTDNGPQQVRYNSGMRGRKGTVYEGGIHVPFFARWPGKLAAGRTVDRNAAAIDVAPTILEACGVMKPAGVMFDGVSLWPLLTARASAADWPDRTLFVQWHRGDVPEKFRAFAAWTQKYKLLRAEGSRKFELFDIEDDPYEQHDLSTARPELLNRLKASYAAWFDDVGKTRGFDPPPRIHLGSPRENPTLLTRQDWRGPRAGWSADSLGYWEVEVIRPGSYDVRLSFDAASTGRVARLSLRSEQREVKVRPGETGCRFEAVPLTPGPGRLEASITGEGSAVGVWSVEASRRD
jgi:arylsulfatase A-like enzyme